MTLTPLDIRRQQFTKAFRGYEPAEVDAFLKQVSEHHEGLLDQIRQSRERTDQMETKLTHYERVELALQEALESAKESARRAEAAAKERASLIVEQAELRARAIVQDAERERHELRQDLVQLSSRQTEVAARLRGFLLSELDVLAQFQGEAPAGYPQLAAPAPPDVSAAPALPEAVAVPEAPAPPASVPLLEESTLPETPAPPADVSEATAEPSPAPADVSDESGYVPLWARAMPDEPQDPSPAPATEDAPGDAPAGGADDAEAAEGGAAGDELGGAGDAEPSAPDSAPAAPPLVVGGWDLRSLVTGEERGAAASDAERERIRRILDDLD
ncbi:DivIVA domain-containing protein [Rubrivirga sp. S365]|uniref:DivIVA domain-containing protein n=1 Tax=Rubrivirga litoralis TaxID=3075598 RepID=A0ABU3BTI2_9BACT|nr:MULTISPECIES: DivIVA domain-containing protein [unclassified Rubrivirga]MDT0632481.1 DivIVA domain-containing protein [Rubrivirga sp. F394]MDT7857981.1 DivIVA domain-containing protein [Rubrivirga sp. S365]